MVSVSTLWETLSPQQNRISPNGDRFWWNVDIDMDIEQFPNRQWYLAQYLIKGKSRENLFNWLSDMSVTPWTPLKEDLIRRSDKICSYRRKINAVFPGYFFLKADLNFQPVSTIKRHSAFIDFVSFGREPYPVNEVVVDGLMKIYPEPGLNPGVREELDAASQKGLTSAQYQHLLQLENEHHPISRISLLLELVRRADRDGF